MTEKQPQNSPKKPDRKARLAAALRENLKRRKAAGAAADPQPAKGGRGPSTKPGQD